MLKLKIRFLSRVSVAKTMATLPTYNLIIPQSYE